MENKITSQDMLDLLNGQEVDFPSEYDISRLERGEKNESLYMGDIYDTETRKGVYALKSWFDSDPKKRELLAVEPALGASIVDKRTNFITAGGIKITSENAQEKLEEILARSNSAQMIENIITDIQVHGYAFARAILLEGQAKIEPVAFRNAYPVFNLANQLQGFAIVHYLDDNDETYCSIQYYYTEGAETVVQYGLYEWDGELGKRVPFTILSDTSLHHLEDVKEESMTTDLPVMMVTDKTLSSQTLGTGVLEKVDSLLEIIADNYTMLNVQFRKHVMPKLLMDRGLLDSHSITCEKPECSIDYQCMDCRNETAMVENDAMELILRDKPDQSAEYVVNSNPQIEPNMKYLEMLLQQLASIASIPQKYLGLSQTGGQVSTESRRLDMSEFLQANTRLEQRLAESLKGILKIALQYEGVKDPKIQIRFTSGLPENEMDVLNAEVMKLEEELTTRDRAIARIHGITPEEAAELQAEIDQRGTEAMRDII